MAFKSNLIQNIHTCQQCNGYGVLNPNDPINQHKDCPGCTGDGVYLKKGNEVFIFGMPTFVNFDNRGKNKIVKIAAGIITVLIIAFLYLVLL